MCALILAVAGCNNGLDHKQNIIGIWRLHSIKVNGQEIGDNKGFIRFWDGGKTMVRTGISLYEMGKWEIDVEKEQIIMLRDTSRAVYQYRMWDDSLLMTRNVPKVITVLRAVKSEDYPVDPASEGADPTLFE